MANIILFDLLKEVEHEIRTTFEKTHEFHVTSQFSEIKMWMQKFPVSCVIASTQTNAKVNDLFKHHYPNLGLILLDNRHKNNKSTKPHVKYMAFQPTMEDLDKTLTKVMRHGAKQTQLQANKEFHQILDKLYQTKDYSYSTFMETSIGLLGTYLKAENTYWLEADKVNFYAHEMWKVRTMDSLKNKGRGEEEKDLFSHKGVTNVDLNKCVLDLNETLGVGWETTKEVQFSDPYLVLPVCHNQSIVGFYIAKKPQKYYQAKHNLVFETLAHYIGHRVLAAKEFSKTLAMTYMDDLTELYNQRYLPIALDESIQRFEEKGECFSVLFMDIDHFKRVNDHRGHMTGSKILVEVGKILKQNIRGIDYGFRYGGDEFLLILTNTDPATANVIAERIRQHVESEVFEVDDKQLQVTLSIGIACYPLHAKNKKEVLEMADKAMYYGKNKSRNIVFMAS